MKSNEIEKKIRDGQAIFCRRVGTKDQEESGYGSQLEIVKKSFPEFSIGKRTIISVREAMSGKRIPKRDLNLGWGKLLGV